MSACWALDTRTGRLFALVMLVGLGACQTSFTGDASFPGGPRGCFDRCAADGMDMASYVYVGEYSTACACKPRVAGPGPVASPAAADATEVGPVVAAAAGVEMQRRREEEAQRRQQERK